MHALCILWPSAASVPLFSSRLPCCESMPHHPPFYKRMRWEYASSLNCNPEIQAPVLLLLEEDQRHNRFLSQAYRPVPTRWYTDTPTQIKRVVRTL
ncbi:hypothetical protein V8C44DRAFT_321112 [Trichoderma aethiopicum]